MIHVIRPPAPEPILRYQKRFVSSLKKQKSKLGRQQRLDFGDYPRRLREFKSELLRVFHGKCAYCEQVLEPELLAVDQFRPKSLQPELAFDWNNLYIACRTCNSHKGDQFPTASIEGAKVPVPLLLDPCSDHPEDYLAFESDGHVRPTSDVSAIRRKRAETTITLLGLNRSSLVAARSKIAEIVRLTIQSAGRGSAELKALLADSSAFAGAARQYSQHFSKTKRAPVTRRDEDYLPKARITFITGIEIRNFRAIQHLKLLLPPPGEAQLNQNWLVFLGENAAGKTSVLQAVALALMGENYLKHWPKNILRIYRGVASRSGSIEIQLTRQLITSFEAEWRVRALPRRR